MKQKKKFGILVIVLIFGMIFAGCNLHGRFFGDDSVHIISIHPSSNLICGVEQHFTVRVQYELSSRSNGQISLSFNTHHIYIAGVVRSVDVTRGIGTRIFDVTVIPKDWHPAGTFRVNVCLLPPPPRGDRPWYSLSSDSRTLTFY